jgi:hypothetical protein
MSLSQLRSNPNSFVLFSPHFLKEEKNKESDILFLSAPLVDQMMKIFITLTFNPATKKKEEYCRQDMKSPVKPF